MRKRKDVAKQKYLQKAVDEEIEYRSMASRFSSPVYPLDLETAS